MDIPKLRFTALSQYITVRLEDVRDGIIGTVTEINLSGGPGAQISLYLDKRILRSSDRKQYMEMVIRNTVESVGNLFEGCEGDDCPQCHGNKVEHLT